VKEGSLLSKCYKMAEISERHRHRYEFNPEYRGRFTDAGLELSGLSPSGTLVEAIELPTHPWFLAVQFHPEFKSKPNLPHPLFEGFIGAALKRRQNRV
jgi:CTP synthase